MGELLEDIPPASFAQSTVTDTPGGRLNSSPQRRAAFQKINRVCVFSQRLPVILFGP